MFMHFYPSKCLFDGYSLVENYFEEGLEDIAKHQEQLWESVREVLTRLASLS